jgi:hypothetical protein
LDAARQNETEGKDAKPERKESSGLAAGQALQGHLSALAALSGNARIRPRVINVDGHPAYARAISELKQSSDLGRRCRPSPYRNNILEQDHRFIKKRIAASLWFRSVDGALNTIDGYEAMNMIRRGQVRWLAKGDVVGQTRFVQRLFGIAA